MPLLMILGLLALGGPLIAAELTPVEQLGKALFFDVSLSREHNQSCAVCHLPEFGWVGGDPVLNQAGAVYEASIPGRFGNRKPSSAAYATQAPPLRPDPEKPGGFLGGHFWDGRATGDILGSPAADQALGPFTNPAEQALPDVGELVRRVKAAPYADLFRQVYGPGAFDDAGRAHANIARAIAAFEASAEVNAFSSKYDAYLAGRATLTAEEKRGLDLYEGKAQCSNCHPSKPGARGEPPLFTDYTFDNLGVPRNPENPFYYERDLNPLGAAWVDLGLGGFLATSEKGRPLARQNLGKMRVPTLRNVALRPAASSVKAYMHNGCFKSLEEVVHFYNTRDVLPVCSRPEERPGVACWPLPEVSLNMNTEELGNLGLSAEEEAAVVTFLNTLSDGYLPTARR